MLKIVETQILKFSQFEHYTNFANSSIFLVIGEFMNSIGIKTSSKDVSYALCISDKDKIITHHLNIEPSLSIGKKLLLIKLDLINFLTSQGLVDGVKMNISNVHIKSAEMNAMTVNPERIMMNGVLIQIFSEFGVEEVTSFNKSNIQKILKKVPEVCALFPEKKVKYDALFQDKLVFGKVTEHFMKDKDFSACTNASTREAGINCIIATC